MSQFAVFSDYEERSADAMAGGVPAVKHSKAHATTAPRRILGNANANHVRYYICYTVGVPRAQGQAQMPAGRRCMQQQRAEACLTPARRAPQTKRTAANVIKKDAAKKESARQLAPKVCQVPLSPPSPARHRAHPRSNSQPAGAGADAAASASRRHEGPRKHGGRRAAALREMRELRLVQQHAAAARAAARSERCHLCLSLCANRGPAWRILVGRSFSGSRIGLPLWLAISARLWQLEGGGRRLPARPDTPCVLHQT